jgi:Protein of unknown function (DUF1572)
MGEQNSGMTHQFTTSYLKDSMDVFRYYKKLGERTIAQCPDETLFTTLDTESNSIAIIGKQMAGNMRSRWTDFLTTDGEKPDRNRDTEFEAPPTTRLELLEMWERGWNCVFDAASHRCRANPDNNHPHRTAFRNAGHQSPSRSLFLSCGANCFSCTARRWRQVANTQRPEEKVSRVQQEGSIWRAFAAVAGADYKNSSRFPFHEKSANLLASWRRCSRWNRSVRAG